MPRPKRPGWSRITITVSDVVAKYIRVQAADQGIEMGTFVDRTINAWLRSIQAPEATATPPSGPGPAATAQRATNKIGPIAPTTLDLMDSYPAAVDGDNPTRMAEFAYQKAVANPGSKVFLPLKHLRVADHATPDTISSIMFRSIIASALSAADFEVRSGFGVRTLKFIDAVIQTADQFYRQLQIEFPVDAVRDNLRETNTGTNRSPRY